MKAKPCMYPFDNFVGYKQTKKSGRTYVNLWDRSTGERSIISLARYRMSVHLGRRLIDNEEVDHADEDFTNDELWNLQILTGVENKQKNRRHRSGRIICRTPQICEMCKHEFFARTLRKLCSISCRSKALKDGRSSKHVYPVKLVNKIKRLHAKGLSSYAIALELGISRNAVMKYW
jgi:hypothetical protein